MNKNYKSLVIVFIFLGITLISEGQDSICHHIITTERLKMNFNVPCDWDSENEGLPYVEKTFYKEMPNNGVVGALLMVIDLKDSLTKKQWASADLTRFFKKESWGTLLKHRSITVSGIKGIEAINYQSQSVPLGQSYQYSLCYLLPYGKHIIIIAYKSMSYLSEKRALEIFEMFELTFKKCASGFILYNNWTIQN